MTAPLRAINAFEDNFRPAELLLKVYQLLDSDDQVLRDGDVVEKLRAMVGAEADEDLLLVHHDLFLGLVRRAAKCPPDTLRRRTLDNLLRQAIVASCTALDAFLPALLRESLPRIIRLRGKGFFAPDPSLAEYFKDVTFSIDETLTLQGKTPEEVAFFVANKIISAVSFKYLGSAKGVNTTGSLLGLHKTWEAVTVHLGHDVKDKEQAKVLQNRLDATCKRRNDIVHRADRASDDLDGVMQDIGFSQTRLGVETIRIVCGALHELVEKKIRLLQNEAATAAGAVAP